MFSSETLEPILSSFKQYALISIPVAIGCFVLGMGVAFIPVIIKALSMSSSSVSSNVFFDDYFEPYIIEEGFISDLNDDFISDVDPFDVDLMPDFYSPDGLEEPDDWWM